MVDLGCVWNGSQNEWIEWNVRRKHFQLFVEASQMDKDEKLDWMWWCVSQIILISKDAQKVGLKLSQ